MAAIMEQISLKYPEHSWELVSRRSIRSIYRLVRQGIVEYYVKIYSPAAPWEKVRNLLKPRTLYEAGMLKQLRMSGIQVPEVEEHMTLGAESALITRAIFPSKNLSVIDRRSQIRIMIEMSINLINHGYHYTDMHAGNIILDENGSPFLLDAYEIIPCRKITLENAADLLAQIVNNYDLSSAEIEPYLARIDGITDLNLLRKRIEESSIYQKRARVQRRVRRSFREGSFSIVQENSSYRAIIHRGSSIDLEKTIDAHFMNVSSGKDLYKIQDKTQLSRVGDYCVKSYRRPRWLLTPYAGRAWKGLLTLLFNDIPVAGPVALVIFRDKKSILITRALDQPDLDLILSGVYQQIPPSEKHRLSAAFGNLIGMLHKKGIYHADLKACNVKALHDPVQFHILDTDRVEQRLSLPLKRRMKNLVQINTSIPVSVSRSVRLAFLKAYCAVTGDNARKLFKAVWQLSSSEDVVYRCSTGDCIEQWRRR